MKKKVLSLLLAVCLIVGMLPLAASAASGDPVKNVSAAILHDPTGGVADDKLHDSYNVSATAGAADDTVDVTITATNLQKHAMGGEGKLIGYWCGFAVVPSGDQATTVAKMKVGIGNTAEEASEAFNNAKPTGLWGDVKDTNDGFAAYLNAGTIKSKVYKVQFLDAADGAIKGLDPVVYNVALNVTLAGEDNVEAAMLDDHGTPDEVDKGLAETYAITSVQEKWDTNYGGYYTDVAVDVQGLKKHQNGQGTMGYWAGIAVLAPTGAQKVKYAFERSFADLKNKESLTETTMEAVNASEEEGLAAYANLGDQSPKTWLKVQWLGEGDKALSTTVYHIDFTGYTLAQPEKNPAPEALIVGNANLEDHSVGGALVAQNQIASGFKTVQGAPVWDSAKNVWYFPITVTADTLKIHANGDAGKNVGYWIGPAIQAPKGIEATDKIKVKTGASMADLDIASDAQASTVEGIHDGVYGVALYTNVTEANTDVVRWMRVQWIDVSEGNKVVRDDIFQITHNVATLETVGLKSVTVYDSTGATLEDGVTATVDGKTITLSGVDPKSATTYTLKYTTTAGGAGETEVTYDGSEISDGSPFTVLNNEYTVKADFTTLDKVKIATGDPAVTLTGIDGNDKPAVEAALKAAKVTGLEALTADVAKKVNDTKDIKDTAKTQLTNAIGAGSVTGDVYIFVQPYLNIEATGYNKEKGTLELNITAKYQTVATTEDDASNIKLGTNAVVLKDVPDTSGNLTVKTPVRVTIQLPKGFVTAADSLSTMYVKHNDNHYHQATLAASGNTYTATFTTEGFSPFVFEKKAAPEASIDDIYYATLQQAVNAVENGGVINVLTAGKTATVSKEIAFKTTGATATINAGTGYKNQGTAPEYKFVKEVGGGSTGGGTTTPSYTVSVGTAENGTVTASPTNAKEGDKVTLTVAPAEGYELGALTVKDASGKTVSTTKVSENEYTFTMPEGNVTVTATFVEKNATPFTDVKTTDWWYEAVKYVYENKLMAGTSDTTFEPTAKLNRAQAVQILYNLEGQPAVTGTADFTDVSGHWALNAITWGAKNGVVAGVGNGKFDPNANVTREQFAQMMYNYAKFKGYDLTAQGDLDSFTDVSKVSDWATAALAWANGEGLINGNTDGTLAPNGTAIRGQAASIMAKFDQNVAEE